MFLLWGELMPIEPSTKRAIAFIDGQNLFWAIKNAFGYSYPNYDIEKLAESICQSQGWNVEEIRFYTGVPDRADDEFWHQFWSNKLAQMGRTKINAYTRPLRYRNKRIKLPDGSEHSVLVGVEKGIDVRLALDVVRLALKRKYDIALIFSQDQDLSEVADEVRIISMEQDRWIKVASAFPVSPAYGNSRGINSTDWIRIDRATYEKCIDPRDYRPASSKRKKG